MKHTVTELKLPSGASGLIIHIPQATVMNFTFNFRAGEYLVTRDKWETPHLMEHMLLGANEQIPKARTFQAEFEKNGAYNNASTGSYDISYEAECADFEWNRIMRLLLVAITKPLFLAEEYSAEFGNVREELTARSNNHFRHLSLRLRQQFGFSVLPDHERLQLMDNVDLQDIRDHYGATHTASNLRFVIAGKIGAARQRSIENLLKNMDMPEGGGRTELPVERPMALKQPLHIHNETVENLYFYLDTFMGRRMSDPESDSLGMLNSILTETFYSRILGTARERGLVYHISSGFGQTAQSTNWWFGAQVMPNHAEALFEIIIHELQDVQSGHLTDEEISAAQQYALGRYQRGGQTVGGIADGYACRYFFDDVIDDYYAIPRRIQGISREGLLQISHDLFQDKVWGLGTLGSSGERFTDQLNTKLSALWQ
jgi:predicted Zn-dependent peptidase